MKEITTKEFVEMFGSEKQIKGFKQRKKITTNVRNALMRQAETEYESIEIKKVGRVNMYVLKNKRDEFDKTVKRDGRHQNGSYTIAYTRDVDLIVLSLLLDKSIDTDTSQTMRKWLLDFGLISKDLFDLLAITYDKRRRTSAVSTLISEKIISSREQSLAIDDYVSYTKELQGQLESSLNRLEKANIINFYPVFWAKLNARDESGKAVDKRVRITENCVASVLEHKRTLMKKYNVENFDILNLHNKKEVISFNRAYKRFLQQSVKDEGQHISIDYIYKAHAIHVKATDKRIKEYLDKSNPFSYKLLLSSDIKFMSKHLDNFSEKRAGRVAELAQKKASYMNSKKLKVEGFSDFVEIFGQTELLDALSINFNRDYYKLFLDEKYVELIEGIENYYSIKNEV